MADIYKVTHSEITQLPVKKILDFLDSLGLPSDNIIAEDKERAIINKNLPEYLMSLPEEVKRDARYLSKYVVGAGFGLFDYSLNAVWNEVTLALRNKAITYGLGMFYDAAVGGKLREAYNTEDDLVGLKDITLLNASKKLELITDNTYKKLSHILDMRNDIGISHPTNYTINGFELLGWLQTCVQDVLLDQPSEAAIQIKAFIDNLKGESNVLDRSKITSILPKIKDLSTHQCSRIVLTLFGLYVADDTSQTLRKNIASIVPTLWEYSQDSVKQKLGLTLEGYNNNLHNFKYEKGGEFFDIVKGNNFRTKSEKLIALNELTEELIAANSGYDNYYHEVPIMSKILTYFNTPKDLPSEVSSNLIHTILKCRIGRGLNYENGVSPKGKPLYNKFFMLMREEFIPEFIVQLTTYDIKAKIRNNISKNQLIELLKMIKSNIVNERYIEALEYLIRKLPSDSEAMLSKDFKKISSAFLTWT